MIAQHSAGAIGGLLAWGFVIENLLNVFLPARASRLLPFLAGNRLLDPRVRPRLVGAHCDCLQPPTERAGVRRLHFDGDRRRDGAAVAPRPGVISRERP